MNKITEEQFYDLLSLKLSGDATAAELALLQNQLLQNPQLQFLYDQVMQPAPAFTDKDAHTAQAYAAHFVKMQLQGKLDEHVEEQSEDAIKPKSSIYRKLVYTTIAIAAITSGTIFFNGSFFAPYSSKKPHALNEIVTKKGSKSNIKLPDGTQVWMNADSKITYSENFVGRNREVTLIGEAYFDVVHDAAHPFIIHTGKTNIKVLGTAFNVRNYPHDKAMETTLMRGRIEVSFNDRPDEKIILKPLEKLIISKENNTIADTKKTINSLSVKPLNKVVLTSVSYASADSIVAETSWMDDKLSFINEPLENIAEEMERQFGVIIIFKNAAAREYRYTGIYEENIEKVLHMISLSKHINYKIENDKITIQ